MALIDPAYCTAADLRRFMSAPAVTMFSDHDSDGIADDGVVEDAINWACEEINGYLLEKYQPADLANSVLLNRWAVVMAARCLCITRGNTVPSNWDEEYDRLTNASDGMLVRIRRGEYELPGVPKRGPHAPSMSNLTVDRRHHRTKIRVIRETSTDQPGTLPQHLAHSWPWGGYP